MSIYIYMYLDSDSGGAVSMCHIYDITCSYMARSSEVLSIYLGTHVSVKHSLFHALLLLLLHPRG